MKKTILILLAGLFASFAYAGNLLNEGFEYANHDLTTPVGWTSSDNSWLCGYLEKDNNRIPHTGNWYAFADAEESWMFMPMYLIPSINYRFTCWAISDGGFQLEFWAGTAPHPDDMHTQLLSAIVESGDYERVSAYVQSIPGSCEYIGIRALAIDGAKCLTIDDIEVDMVEQYTFEAEAVTGDTAMYPGTEATFHFLVHNTGYDPVSITLHPSNEYFTDFSCHFNGTMGMTIPTQPDEVVMATITATLKPEIEPGTVCWLDVHMTIPCNCNTAMVTFWVTPLDLTQTEESTMPVISVYPNPASDFVTIEAEGLQRVSVTDKTGRMMKGVPASGNALHLDVTDLKAGVYFISVKTASTSSFVKPILKM